MGDEAFRRTAQTATGADSIAALLSRAAVRASGSDTLRLRTLAERYRDYAQALRETIGDPEPEEPEPDHPDFFMVEANG